MKGLLIAGIIFFIGPLFSIKGCWEKFNVERNGHIVKMKIEKLPNSCIGAKNQYYVYFSYGGKMYDIQTRGAFCDEHSVGELMDMKMLEGSEYILFPDESALKNLISLGILSLFGLILAITQWKKIQNEK